MDCDQDNGYNWIGKEATKRLMGGAQEAQMGSNSAVRENSSSPAILYLEGEERKDPQILKHPANLASASGGMRGKKRGSECWLCKGGFKGSGGDGGGRSTTISRKRETSLRKESRRQAGNQDQTGSAPFRKLVGY